MDVNRFTSSSSFKHFVISILRQIASSKNQELVIDSALPYDVQSKREGAPICFDAYASDGFDEIDGPVVFEFKYYALGSKSNSFSSLYNQINKQAKQLSSFVNQSTFIVITNAKILSCDYHSSFDKNLIENINVMLWGSHKIEQWIEEYPIDYSNALSLKVSATPDTYISEITEGKFDEKSQNNILAVKRIIKTEDNFAIALGAGISIDPGAKDWKSLLIHFTNELKKTGIIDNADTLCGKIGGSTVITAQLCKELYPNESDYFWAIHQGLYENKQPINFNYSIYHIARIAEECVKKPHFRILTYNYDEYLEEYLRYFDVPYNSLYDSACEINGNVSIYHVHGFIPKVNYKTHILDRYRKSIYLTEEDYNELYNHPYSWQISSQLSFFRENKCLFVGCSLADPNIRRLLEMTKKENRIHFAILSKDKMTSKDLTKAANHFARLGIEIIWVNSFFEIGKVLRMLYST